MKEHEPIESNHHITLLHIPLLLIVEVQSIFTVPANCDEGGPIVWVAISVFTTEECSLRESQRIDGRMLALLPLPMEFDHQIRGRFGVNGPEAGDNQRNTGSSQRP